MSCNKKEGFIVCSLVFSAYKQLNENYVNVCTVYIVLVFIEHQESISKISLCIISSLIVQQGLNLFVEESQ